MKNLLNDSRIRRRSALLLIVVGALPIVFPQTAVDYVCGFFAPNGIYIPRAHYKFGAIQKSGEISHTFRIYNLRPRTLEVSTEPDCGCTTVSWKQASIAPFAWRDVSASMFVKKNETGQKPVSITFSTNSSKQPWIFVSMGT